MQKLDNEESKQNITRDTDEATEGQNETMGTEYGEAELEILNRFLQETCSSLLAVNKDLLNRELHLPEAVEILKAFAQDKGQRALVVAKVEKDAGEQSKTQTEASASDSNRSSVPVVDANIELVFSTKVEYLGHNAQTVAFLKREEYAKLDLKPDLELEKVLDSAIASGSSDAGQTAEQRVDLSEQIQIVNLGYLGQESNIFELASTYVDFSFLPLFHDYKNKTQIKNPSATDQSHGASGGLEGILKGLSSLKMHLAQCRQNLKIPMVELKVDPEIKAKYDATKAAGEFFKVADFEDRIGDTDFTNRMISYVNGWYKDIRKVTQLVHVIETGTALQEINFWDQMERSLNYIKEQLANEEVQMTLEILSQAKMYRIVMQFHHDTEIDPKLKTARDYNKILKDIPIKEVLDALTIEQLSIAIKKVFNTLKRVRQTNLYSLPRAIDLAECIARDFGEKLKKVVSENPIMQMPYEEHKVLQKEITDLQTVWVSAIQEFKTSVGNKITSAKHPQTGNKQIDMRIKEMSDDPVFKRLNAIGVFRSDHYKLDTVISSTFGKGDSGSAGGRSDFRNQALTDIREAYDTLVKSNPDVLDTTQQGNDNWSSSKKAYEMSTSKIESQLTQLLKQKLAKAVTANEMFQVFADYNQLLMRPKIRGTITQYQSELLRQVHKDIDLLKTKLLNQERMDKTLIHTRDIPEIVNKIVWMSQLEHKLQFYQERVGKILGKDWREQQEGRELDRTCGTVHSRLVKHQQDEFNKWIKPLIYLDYTAEMQKPILVVQPRGNKLHLALNFNEDLLRLHKEKNSLIKVISHFGLQMNMSSYAQYKSDEFQKYQPIAMSLQQSLRTFQVTIGKVTDEFEMLISKNKAAAQEQLMLGLKTPWKVEQQTRRFAQRVLVKVIAFEEEVNNVMRQTDYINDLLVEMKDCELVKAQLEDRLTQIQKVIGDFDLEELSNMTFWVTKLNERIETILITRLEQLLKSWIEEFTDFEVKGGQLIKSKMVLDIKLANRTIMLEPSLAEARSYWYKELHNQVEVICGLEKLSIRNDDSKERTYKDLLLKMGETFNIKKAYTQIEEIFNKAEVYVNSWKAYQALWDIDQEQVYGLLGDNIDRWNQLLNEIRQGRKTFDTSEDFRCFGGLEISYKSVQDKVNSKYDQIHIEILNKFGSTLAENMKEFKQKVQHDRRMLEGLNLEEKDVTVFVTEIQEMNRVVNQQENQLDRCKAGQKLLQQQRFKWPDNWLWIDVIEGEWAAFRQILGKRSATMQEQIPALQAKILAEDEKVIASIKEIELEWKEKRPKDASTRPGEASNTIRHATGQLGVLGAKITKAIDELGRVCKAKELLDMELGDPSQLDNLQEDQKNLLQVWQKIQEIWVDIDKIDATPFQVYVHKTVKDCLDAKMNEMREFPNRMRSYQIYETYMDHLKAYKKVNDILSELRSDAMKPKHWRELLQKLKIGTKQSELHLSDLWHADLLGKNKIVQDILTQARGEAILENFINGIKETWAVYELELVKYQTKCKLIKGWDELFEQCDEHMNNINSMKMSPYYKVFEKDIEPWSRTLEQIKVIFDYWIDVQRRYVYLEGIFFGSADIKSMLSNEFTKFKNIDNDFTRLMKVVNKQPIVLEVLKIPNLEKNLQGFTNSLEHIQKALGEYLEKQRSNFARFYFVGDEDLLEIIGNSKEIKNVMRHFPKMFQGITTVNFENEGDSLTGMNSREGESVGFHKPVVISEDPTIYIWLNKVQNAMQVSLAMELAKGLEQLEILDRNSQQAEFNDWIKKFPAQIVILSMQVSWSNRVEDSLNTKQGKTLQIAVESIRLTLEMLADMVLTDLTPEIRKKYEQLITDLVHQREVTTQQINEKVTSRDQFPWLYHMRFYFNAREQETTEQLSIQMANGHFFYGFEYLGVGEKLVQTPLTDKCYLTLTQALHWRMGGSPFGPAGTGKTESVKALGSQLGRFVLVFNCDETFDGKAMGRIFVGLCQVGAWGCFDEFNRLEERMLSAVSQQILTIQTGLREQLKRIDLMDREVKLNSQMGIFITMNPGYAGRSELPDNLKQLFRQVAMTKPDKELIARVMLYSQGFRTSERLSGKIVSLFDLCAAQLSSQSHYDFGLRALKAVLISAGNLKRREKDKVKDAQEINEDWEANILIKSLCDTFVPKLIADDIPLLSSLLSGVFPGSSIIQERAGELKDTLFKLCPKYNLESKPEFIEKCMQLYQIQNLHHGLMLVGPTGVGKTAAWKLLLDSMSVVDNIPGVSYVVDPKSISKDELYGKLDNTTAEWTDGVFTGILRKIIDNARGEVNKRHWIIFDGDVDPEWAENLNSVLDDNKLLTLPSGERLMIPKNVRIMFEVENLKHATLATVSRCGMVWFSDETVKTQMMFYHYMRRLAQDDYDSIGEIEEDKGSKAKISEEQAALNQVNEDVLYNRGIRKQCVEAIRPLFDGGDEDYCFASKALEYAEQQVHVMDFTKMRCLEATFALIRRGIENVLEYNEAQSDFPLEGSQIAKYMTKWVVFSTIWGIGGSMNLQARTNFSNKITEFTDVDTPPLGAYSMIDYEIRLNDQKWHTWKESVYNVDIPAHQVTDADVVIPTVDTARHQEVLCSWLSERRPFILCGPPGSGKTMTLMATLKKLTDMEMIFINFSSSTTPEYVLKTFDQYCEVRKTNHGFVMQPLQASKWLVVFCDEINLPSTDRYGTQPVITFLRQLTEQNGFFRASDKQWVKLERMMFVGACNPPTDSGRSILSNRFLRHAPLIFVDFPGVDSLKQIYGTFNRAMLKRIPSLKHLGDPLTEAMVEFYTKSQLHFTADQQPHYIYSPRELTRWKYALNQALEPLEDVEDLVRLYVHEGLRLFEDRLVYQHEKDWCNTAIDQVASKCFGDCDLPKALERPIYFTNYLNKNYVSVCHDELKDHIEARLKQFQEEELDIPLVVFDSVLDHIVRIDRVLRQPLGHLLLVGASGVGKTTLTRFVAWMQDLDVFQIKAGRNYSVTDFDEDLRKVMRSAGVDKKKTCFVFDESNVLSAAFLERMNALLAGGDVPGLFEGDEFQKLIASCKEQARKDNMLLDTEEEFYRQFTKDVQRNLHVVFTMNPANPDFSNRTASSPALFNRCVIDWFGDWTDDGLLQVAMEFTRLMELTNESFTKDMSMGGKQGQVVDVTDAKRIDPKNELLSETIVEMHIAVRDLNIGLMKNAKKYNFITPRDFLDFIKHFVDLNSEKKNELHELQEHLEVGITKLKNTEKSVKELGDKLMQYDKKLISQKKQVDDKMKLLTVESQKVNNKKEIAEQTRIQLSQKQEEAAERKVVVENDLGKAEPALISALSSVQGVNSGQITELQRYAKPPERVRIALEPVVALLMDAHATPTWQVIRSELQKPDFKNNVLNFDKDRIGNKCKNFISKTYLQSGTYDIAGFYKASQAAGPLADWMKSIIEYADIFERIAPLRAEIDSLEQETYVMEEEMAKLEAEIKQLQLSFDKMQNEFQQLIQDLTKLEEEQKTVKNKVERSDKLFKNLSSELIRWEGSSQDFKDKMANLIGDTLLSSGFLTYIGFFDHSQRMNLQDQWKLSIYGKTIKYSGVLSLTEFLSKPQERVLWKSEELPDDDLCIENAIILQKFNRYPLIIDPSDQALKYIMNHYKGKKIQKTSFADSEFLARISEGLQYGVPVLVQDVEKIDPIMNSVLNREVQKVGGRLVIQVGDKEIACNGELTLFMMTRNQNAAFAPDLCSRVTFVNFTVTPSSLMNQCLNIYLKSERPQIDEKRTGLLKLQGEFKEKLRQKEDDLLDALNKSKGEILENDELIQTLESLKKESGEIAEQAARTDETLEEIQEVSNEYKPLAQMTSRIFFSLESMSAISYLYQFSLQQFMTTMNSVLMINPHVKAIPKTKERERLKVITEQLFVQMNQNICQGLLQEHQFLFTLRLAQIRLAGDNEDECGKLLEKLFSSAPLLEPKTVSINLIGGRLTKSQIASLEDLAQTEYFNNLIEHMESEEARWISLLEHPQAENEVPEPWRSGDDIAVTNKYARSLKKLIILKLLRPDRLLASVKQFLELVLGNEIVNVTQVNLMEFVSESHPKSPLLLVSAIGFDASYRVDQLAKQANKKYTSIAIGSPEAFGQVDTAIRNASKSGNWVLLKNVHLAPQWLVELEKMIYDGNPNENFRLFLTMENNPKVPYTLLRASQVLVFEPPSGVKAALVRSYTQTITPERTDRDPVERKRLHFIVSWFNAVVQERLRYTPIGWSKAYEFNESDQRCTLDCIDEWIDSMGTNRSNIDPDRIPWDALRTLISQSVFGGKIDNEFDNKILLSLVNQFFRPESYNNGFKLFESTVGDSGVCLTVPEEKNHAGFIKWIKAIELTETPAWSGLPNNVEKLTRERQATQLVADIKKIQGTGDDLTSETQKKSKTSGKDEAEGQSAWLQSLKVKLEILEAILPGQLELLNRTEQSIKNPLFRFLEREVVVASGLLDIVREDIIALIELCQAKRKSTQQLKQLAEELFADIIPKKWRKYTIANISATAWVNDFVKRVDQLKKLSNSKDFGQSGLWYGGLLFPEAYLTATRQAVAQNNNYSLEELELKFEIDLTEEEIKKNPQGFIQSGFSIQGAEYSSEEQRIRLTESLQSTLPNVNFKWVHKSEIDAEIATIEIPVYLNTQRTNLITSVQIPTSGIPSYVWYQRGVALFAWNQE